MTWVLGNACVLTPGLYRRLKRLAQTVVALGLLSPKSGKMEQKSLGYRKLARSLQNSAVYRVVCASVAIESRQCLRLQEVPSVTQGWMWDPIQSGEYLE